MMQRHLLIFTFLVSFVLNAYSAIELRSTQMRTSDGLPNNSIRYIYQDSKGFLWLATLNGLSRYDGNSFLTFRPEIGDEVSLADNRIYDLTEDKDGFLWISAMICNVPVLWTIPVVASQGRIIQRFLSLLTEMSGFPIREMAAGRWYIRKMVR